MLAAIFWNNNHSVVRFNQLILLQFIHNYTIFLSVLSTVVTLICQDDKITKRRVVEIQWFDMVITIIVHLTKTMSFNKNLVYTNYKIIYKRSIHLHLT